MLAPSIALLLIGAGLLVAEAHLPTYGLLGTVGSVSMATGIVLAVVDFGGSPALALAVALPLALVLFAVGAVAARKAISASRLKPRGGAEDLVGRIGVVRRPLDPVGHVQVAGELWRARRSWAEEDDPPPAEGESVVVDRVQGLTLSVRRAEIWEVEG